MVLMLLLILCFLPMIAAQPWQICGTRNYTANTTYQFNIDYGLSYSSLRTGRHPLFAKGSTGEPPNTVYAVALCRGDLNTSSCSACVDAAFKDARQLCGLSKDATIFYDECTIRFSDVYILDMDSSNRVNTSAIVDGALILMNISSEPMFPGWDAKNQQATGNFTRFFKKMLSDTIAQVLSTTKYYAAIRVDTNDGSTTVPQLYCLAQCAPDLVEDICYDCIQNFSDLATANFAGRQGGRVLGLPCNLRYDTSKFFAGEPTWISGSSNALVPSPSPSPQLVLQLPSPKPKSNMNMNEDEALILGLDGRNSEFTVFEFSQVAEATGNFSEENKLGQGGFGPVYKVRW
ncbi:unnamed protein product [Miscanthus lutarioriparius]|uniref:Gnk2-homologous domain-containing protein n=1 Tax=Miscanthus lutarioriparius TaxID=422564 RepID=A0A811Q7F3_9POAL|nr:unnamed protein product [Miscanthus lutarioriparius]